MNDQNERNDPSRQDQSNSDQERASSQGQASSGQAGQSQGSDLSELENEGMTSPDHEQGAMGGSVTSAGGSSSGAGAGSAGLDREQQGFLGSQESDSGDYLQEDSRDQPDQGGFAEEGQGAPEDSEPGGIEGLGERSEDSDSESDIEGSSRT